MANRIINGIPFDANAIIDQEGEVSYDYVLFAEDIAQWLSTYFGNGILVPKAALMTTQFQVSKVSETQVSINKGNIVINGRTGFLKNPYNMNIDYAHVGKQRIDRIVIELNTNETVNEFRPLVLKGVESEQNPQIPDITRDAYLGIYQMSLANVLVTADGVQTITDERNDSNLCGVSQVLIGVKPAVPVTGDSALNISYDNSYTGAEEKTVQDALDNLYNTKKKILLNGVDQQELKLSTKYQWVVAEPIDFGDISYNTIKKFVYYKNEIHVFTKASSNNHFKLVNGQLLPDVDVPFPPSDYVYNWVCADDNYIYGIGNVSGSSYGAYEIKVYRFDGETWEEIFVLPKESPSDYLQYLGTPSVLSGKLYLSFRTSARSKQFYAGYLNLATLTWVALPTLPSSDMYGYNAFTEIDGVIYSLCGSGNNTYFYKLNANNSWTSLSYPTSKIIKDYFDMLTINNKAYIIQPSAFYCFDGSKVKLLSTLDTFEYPSLLFTNKFCIFGQFRQAVGTSSNVYLYDVFKTYEKVLCLEE